MWRDANTGARHGAVNLGQGFPDWDCAPALKALVAAALDAGHNQYAPMAGVAALQLPDAYYQKLTREYTARKHILLDYLTRAGFRFSVPQGAYYVLTDITPFGATNDVEFGKWLVTDIGVAGVPGSSFYKPAEAGRTRLRFMWAKKEETLHAAGERLLKLRELVKA